MSERARSVPAEHTLAPRVDIRNDTGADEEQDARQEQSSHRTLWFELRVRNRPWVEEDHLNVEEQERHRHYKEAHVEALACGTNGFHA